ncbi:MAG: hypothetical protein GY817_00580 [bacterium]|nr:hypothetical protein [bacterium]
MSNFVFSDKAVDNLHVTAGILWLFLTILLFFGQNMPLMYLAFLTILLLIIIYFVLGTMRENKIGFIFPLVYPILIMAVFWLLAFSIAMLTKGKVAVNFIFGMHPGWIAVLGFFWLGTFLTTTLGYALLFDTHILTESKWNNFMDKVSQMEKMN